MKENLKELYDINVISFIKISDKVYKVKGVESDYCLKYIDKNNIENMIEKLKIIKIDFFLYPIKNFKKEYVSNYEGVNFVLYPWINEDCSLMKDLKLNFFLNSLAELHNKSFYTIKTNEVFFKETYDYIASKIDKVEEYIETYMTNIERLDYKSPSQWLFLLNYPLYVNSISKANKYLDSFKEKCEKKNTVRLSLTYNNFDYKHIMLKEEKVLGIENVEITSPIYDIFYTFSTLDEVNIDTKIYYEKYFKKFILDDYEKDWLLALLFIPRIKDLSSNEINNIKEVTNSLNYIKNSEEIAKLISKYEEKES